MAPVLSGGVAPEPSSAAASPGWFRPLKSAAAAGAVDVAGCDGAVGGAAAALTLAVRSSSGCMNLAGSGDVDLPLPICGLAVRTLACTCPTAGTTFGPGPTEATGAAVAVVGMARSSAAA